jgi:hypothetical protein
MNETTVPTATVPEAACAPATATTTARTSMPAPSATDWNVAIVRCPRASSSRWRSLSSQNRPRWRSSCAKVRTVRMPEIVSSRMAICWVAASRAARSGSRARRWSSRAPAGDAPLVLASLGTVLYAQDGVREAILDALRDEPVRLVLALGPDADPARWGRVGPNIQLVRRAPQPWLLPHCAAFVTHGGANSVREALLAGTPLVVVPLGFDQPYHARRCTELGIARTVTPEHRSAEAIRAAVRDVLADRSMAKRARVFAREMAALPDVDDAVRLLERLAGV